MAGLEQAMSTGNWGVTSGVPAWLLLSIHVERRTLESPKSHTWIRKAMRHALDGTAAGQGT